MNCRWVLGVTLFLMTGPLLAAIPADPALCQSENCIQIGSFNIEYLGQDRRRYDGQDRPRRATAELDALVQLVATTLDLEAVVLQEIHTGSSEWAALRQALESEGYRFFEGTTSGRNQFVVLGWDSDEVMVLEPGRELPIPDSFTDPDNPNCSYQGLRLPAAVRLKANEFDFWLIGVHLKSRTPVGGLADCDDWIRMRQTEELVKAADKLAADSGESDILMLGDFNHQDDHWSLKPLRDAGFTSQMRYLKTGSGDTTYLKGGRDVIDHVMLRYSETRELVPMSGYIFAPASKKQFVLTMSDHAPVLASFRIGQAVDSNAPVAGDGAIQVGDTIELKATHHLGVPLHREAQASNDFSRVPDGTRAKVVDLAHSGHWLKIKVSGVGQGWIIEDYARATVSPGPTMPEQEEAVWSSRAECLTAVAAGARMQKPDDALRIGTWNVRWFPRGCSPSEQCPENATDLQWLACTIAWMDVDVLAVQEILDNDDDRFAMATMIQHLESLGGGTWNSDLHNCAHRGDQHVGYLWRQDTVALSNFSDEEQLNGAAATSGRPCAGNLRPGRYARVESTSATGVDFHLLSVHFDSGVLDRDYQNRRNASGEIPHLEIGGEDLTDSDRDILVVGDFNTMGRPGESPYLTAKEEIEILDEELSPGYHRISAEMQCSEYYKKKPGLLDHIVVSDGMAEASSQARLSGYCAQADCRPLRGNLPAAYRRLSDHCPVVMDVKNLDIDSGG